MKVMSFNNVNAVNPYRQQQRNVSTTESKSAFTDKIEISMAAKELQVNSNYSNERTEKIQQLKADIESNQYKVDARKVAEDMLKYYRL